VDLFVRTTNTVAIGMYEQFGYSVYRRVKGYYHSSSSGNRDEDEDAFGICSSLYNANGRYEETFDKRQVQAECKGEWS
jgi:N-terminal acetyltransferase B complex catalytic subunit